MRISFHAKKRLVQRDNNANCHTDAKKLAKIAFNSGDTINAYQKYPQFFAYLTRRRNESATCRIRIYHGNIYIWKGSKKTLVTAHPIPERFKEEIRSYEEKGGVKI